MSQLTLFDYITRAPACYLAAGYISNGYVGIRSETDLDNPRMVELIKQFLSPGGLAEARPIMYLRSINNLPAAVAFWVAVDLPAPPLADLSSFCFINHDLYRLITGVSLWVSPHDQYFTYRFLCQKSRNGDSVPAIGVYDVDGDLLGFCAGLRVLARDEPLILAELNRRIYEVRSPDTKKKGDKEGSE